jgi:gamma-glutamyltranspeptidase/glutathione hydrolase
LFYLYQRRRWSGASREACVAEHGLVASKHRLIGETGIDILRRGGNAVDAAVAAAFVDCVVEPAMNGIGGEGVMAIHLVNGENVIIDYVGRPSKNCTPDMYELLDEIEPGWMGWRRVKGDANVIGHKAVTVPGTVAGLAKALELYGTMELGEVLEPAIRIAEEGFIIGWWTFSHIVRTMETFSRFPEWRRLFLKEERFPPRPYYYNPRVEPERLINRNLARSLRLIAEGGPDAFYKGEIAEAIVREMETHGGLITAEDMAMYEPIVLKPTLGSYRGYDILYDPSHAGTTLVEILNILEGYDLKDYGFGSFEHIHLVAEAIALAYADRFEYMGDPGFVRVPQRGMVSKAYAEKQRGRISFERALEVKPGDPWPYDGCTTALAVVDEDRNAVVINQTLVNAFGSGVVVPGTGIVLNNAMYGLNPEPGYANSIDGRKRRIQNVCPTILLQGDEPYLAVGAPGGRAIQTSIAQVILHVVDFGMDIQSAIDAPRITREVGEILLDSRFSEETYKRLVEIGHEVVYIDKELANWARPVGIVYDKEGNLL